MKVRIISLTFLMIGFSTLSFAKTNYVKGVQRITFRTGPGTDNKIIKMLDAEAKVQVLENGTEWTKVKDADGNEGYILNRFLTEEVPHLYRYQWLKSKYDKLDTRFKDMKTKQNELKSTLKTRETELTETSKELTTAQTSFEDLKKGSAEYLKLQSTYKRTKALLEDQNSRVISLESQLSKYYIYWFLAGAGVLFLGWVIGLTSRKKRHAPGLSF